MKKTKNKGRKIVLLVCGILLALAVIAGGAAAVLFMNNGSASEAAEYSGQVQIQDEQALRAALKSKGECEIVLSEDIVITKELEVFGDKKLSGGSIIMDMHREGSGESVLAIQKGAKLVLDGTTVDGNSVVNCISVKSGGELDSQSGSLLYGYPYGLDVSGKVTITDIVIDEALHTGVNVAIFGEVDMLGGTISHNVYGIAVAEEGRMDIADGVSMTKSAASFIVNYGKMDIRGGKYEGANDNAIENWGTMSVKGTENDPVEIWNGKKSAINAKNNAKLTVEHVNIHDMGWHAMCVEKNTTATLKNIHIDTTGKSTLYVNSAKATMENITILNGTAYGVYATKNAKVDMTHVTIKDMKNRAVMNEASELNAEDLVIENSTQHGVYTTGVGVVTTINNATITGTERSAFAVVKGKGTITNSYMANTKREIASVAAEGNMIIEDCTLENAGNFAIASYGGVAKATDVVINDSGNASVLAQDGGTFTGDGLTIKNSAKQAIRIEKGAVGKVTNCKIDTTGTAAVYVDASKLTLKSATINNAKTYGVAAKNCKKANGKSVQLDKVTVNNPGEHGIGSINSYMVAGNIKVTNPKRCGVYSEGAEAIINMAGIEVYKAGTCALGFKGAAEITARNVTIDSPAKEGIYATAGAVVKKLDNITIKDPGTHGISVDANSTVTVTVDTKYNPENTKGNGVTVLNPGKNGIRCSAGTVSAKGVTIKNAGGQAISANKESKVTVNGCTIDKTVQAAVYAEESRLTLKDATIDNAGTYGVAAKNGKKEKEQLVQLDGVQINKPGEHGIGSINSYMVAGNIKVTEPKRCGVYSEGAEAIINMAHIEVYKAGTCGFGFKGAAEITARNVTIDSSKNEGIYATSGAVVKKLDNITIKNPGTHGVSVDGNSSVVITVDTTYNPENTKGNGVTVLNPGQNGIRGSAGTVSARGVTIQNAAGQGISANAESNVTVNGCSIDTTAKAAVYANNSNLTLKNATVKNAGTTAVAAENCLKENSKTVQLDGVVISDPAEYGIYLLEGSNITVNNSTVENTGKHGIYITTGAEAAVGGTTVKNAGDRAVHTAGVLNVNGLTLDGATDHGIYLGANASISGSDLTIRNAGDNGIFSEGAPMDITGLTVENTVNQGVQVKSGTVKISDFTMKETGGVAMRVRNDAVVTMVNGTVYAYAYGIYADGTSGTTVTDVVIERTAKDGAYTTNHLVSLAGSAKVELGGTTKIDGKDKEGCGVNVAASTAAFTLNGAAFTGNTTDIALVKNATVKLQQALTADVSLKLGEYTEGLLVAEKAGEISDADFKASMKLLKPVETNWFVNNAGYLSSSNNIVAIIGEVTYATLEAAVDAANASAGADIIKVLKNVTVKAQLKTTGDVTITADKAITITADMNGGIFNVTGGTLAITGTSETAKITLAAGTKTTNMVYVNGGNADLTNVELIGNKNTTAGNNSTYGIYNNAGHVTAKSVTIQDILKGDGINIRAGATADLDNVTISGTGRYGIKSYGTVNVYNTANVGQALSISNTNDHAIDLEGSGGKLISNFANVPAGTYAIAIDTTVKTTGRGIIVRTGAELDITDVSIQNVKHNGVDLVAASSVASITNATVAADGYGINAVANSSLTMGNVAVTGSPAGVNLAENAKIKLSKALTENITVQLGAYGEGVVVAEKAGEISNADFAASMALLIPVDTNWFVDSTGKLAKVACEHSWTEEITTQPTCSAEGVKTYTCSFCGASYTEPVPTVAHTVAHVDAVAPTAEADGNIEYWYCTVCGTVWEDAAQTKVISLANVVLPKGSVAYISGKTYDSLENAVAAAEASEGADTIKLLCDVTVQAQLKITSDITITADNGVAITAPDTMTGGIFNISGGTVAITGASETAKITVAAGKKTTNIVYNNGGSVSLTNVNLAGNSNSTAGNNATYGIYNNAGHVNVKSVAITNIVKGDGINIRAGASADLDNVTINNTGRYGIKTFGTVNIYNTVHSNHALTIQSSYDHGIDIDNGGSVTSQLTGVADGSYAININTTRKTSGMGIIVRTGGSLNVSHVSIANVLGEGLYFQAGGTVSDFVINGTGKNAIYLTKGASVTLNDGTVTTAVCSVKTDAGTTLTVSNVSVQTTTDVAATTINGTLNGEITVVTA